MWSWYRFWLLLHILTVIIAFGPTFAFPLIATFGQRHPQFALAAAEISGLIAKRLVLPLAVAVPAFGVALIVRGDFDFFRSDWLLIAVILYAMDFFFSLFVQSRWGNRMVQAMRAMPPGPPPAGSPPPAEIVALGKRLQWGGIYLTLSFLVILVLMIWKPGNCQGVC